MWYALVGALCFVAGVVMDEFYGSRAVSGLKLEIQAFKNEVLSFLQRIEARIK